MSSISKTTTHSIIYRNDLRKIMDVRQAYNRLVNFKKHISCIRKTKGGINRAIDW